jgi:hypothetical protein
VILFSVTDSANIFWDSNCKIYLFSSIELITECVQSLITEFFLATECFQFNRIDVACVQS